MSGTLAPIYNIVAREVALGIPLVDICDARGLKLATVQKVARGDLFQENVRRFQAEIDQEIIQDAVSDPVLAKLRALSYRAVGTLAEEMESFDKENGASAATRISASKEVLNRAGYAGKSEGEGVSKVILLLSESKLDAIKQATEITEYVLAEVPDNVDGHLKAS